MAMALRAVRVLLSGGVLTEPQGRAGKKGSFWEPFLLQVRVAQAAVRVRRIEQLCEPLSPYYAAPLQSR